MEHFKVTPVQFQLKIRSKKISTLSPSTKGDSIKIDSWPFTKISRIISIKIKKNSHNFFEGIMIWIQASS